MIDTYTKAVIYLYNSQMFYAELLSEMKKIVDPKLPAVAGVCIREDIELHINPKLFEKLPVHEAAAVLAHECEHILRDHISRAKDYAPEIFEKNQDASSTIVNNMKHKGLNIAMDCAINGNLKDLPDWCVYPSFFDLPASETAEWYMDKLKDNEKFKDCMDFDGHDLWKETDKTKEYIKEKIRQASNSAAKKTRAAGRMTNNFEMLVSQLNANSVNWRAVLKQFVSHSMEVKIETSRKKRNRRYGIKWPGHVKIENLHVGVAIDTSGSVPDKALTQFMSEIANMSKYARVTVVEADTEVKAAYEFKKNKEYRISGRGGTAYQPAFDYFNAIKDIDAVIYFGDMDCADKPEKPKYPVLWAIYGSQKPPASFGKKVTVEIKNENS